MQHQRWHAACLLRLLACTQRLAGGRCCLGLLLVRRCCRHGALRCCSPHGNSSIEGDSTKHEERGCKHDGQHYPQHLAAAAAAAAAGTLLRQVRAAGGGLNSILDVKSCGGVVLQR
jgi:hypothetical protein